MTFTAQATYFPNGALFPEKFGGWEADTREEAVAILMDELREFTSSWEDSSWWDDVIVSIQHDHVITNYPFEFWAKHFGWSF